jgi:uncharacterized protein
LINQYGALPYRFDAEGRIEILLVTSRDTGRWVVPKGNPIAGLNGHESASREAYEEAGVEGRISAEPLGSFGYAKRRGPLHLPARVTVYALEVGRQHDDWPERGQRASRWFAPDEASQAVAEPELKALIADFPKVLVERNGDRKGTCR